MRIDAKAILYLLKWSLILFLTGLLIRTSGALIRVMHWGECRLHFNNWHSHDDGGYYMAHYKDIFT